MTQHYHEIFLTCVKENRSINGMNVERTLYQVNKSNVQWHRHSFVPTYENLSLIPHMIMKFNTICFYRPKSIKGPKNTGIVQISVKYIQIMTMKKNKTETSKNFQAIL